MLKTNNKILLEAINRGIKLALDDFDFNDNIESKATNDIIDADNYIEARIKFDKLTKEYYKEFNGDSRITVKENILKQILPICNKFKFKFKPVNNGDLQIITYFVEPDADLNWLDVSEITNMDRLFMNQDFNGNISEWDVSHVTSMNSMFNGSSFNGNISNWNVINVEYANQMFAHSEFNSYIGDWRFRSLESGDEMFWGTNFNQDISKWDHYIQFNVLKDLLVGANKLSKDNKPASQRKY